MNSILLARFYPGRSVVIHNLNLIESDMDRTQEYALASPDELITAIERHFGIAPEIVAEAIEGLGALRDAWNSAAR